jgi:hypothetical protein
MKPTLVLLFLFAAAPVLAATSNRKLTVHVPTAERLSDLTKSIKQKRARADVLVREYDAARLRIAEDIKGGPQILERHANLSAARRRLEDTLAESALVATDNDGVLAGKKRQARQVLGGITKALASLEQSKEFVHITSETAAKTRDIRSELATLRKPEPDEPRLTDASIERILRQLDHRANSLGAKGRRLLSAKLGRWRGRARRKQGKLLEQVKQTFAHLDLPAEDVDAWVGDVDGYRARLSSVLELNRLRADMPTR